MALNRLSYDRISEIRERLKKVRRSSGTMRLEKGLSGRRMIVINSASPDGLTEDELNFLSCSRMDMGYLLRELENLQDVWVRTDKRQPEERGLYFCLNPGEAPEVVYFSGQGKWYQDGYPVKPVYWMSIPRLP